MLLLDTHYLIWWATNSPRMSKKAHDTIESASAVYYSAASIFEIEAKRHRLPGTPTNLPDVFERLCFEGLAISVADAAASSQFSQEKIPDPFDRLLLAQANNRGLTFLTADRKILLQDFNFVVGDSD